MMFEKKETLKKIIQLTNNALVDPQIYSDKNLNELLLKIREEALSGEVFYD
ncbi:bacteriocin immunity protein, partial [Enterococcus faecalis]|nr:bacteriocin immunity protein [Enterococcus faecalis]